jgi:hypothetical protein
VTATQIPLDGLTGRRADRPNGCAIMTVEPVFVRRPGQVDYTHIRYAPALNALVVCLGKVLLQQRSSGMAACQRVCSTMPSVIATRTSWT